MFIFRFLALYGLFYTISYVFMMPSASEGYLPIVRIGNNDIFSYLISAGYLQRLGPSNIANFSFLDSPSMILTFTPAVFDAIIGIGTFFNDDMMRTAIPTLFGIVALIGCVTVWLTRSLFSVSIYTAISIAAVLISGPLLRYIVGNYFLSQLVAILFVLLMLGKTSVLLTTNISRNWHVYVLWFLPYYILIFYSYPPLFVIGIGLQLGFMILFYLLSIYSQRPQTFTYAAFAKNIGQWMAMAMVSFAFIGLIDPGHFRRILDFTFNHLTKKGIVPWILDFVSPFAILGLPVPLEIHGFGSSVFLTIFFLIFISVIGYFYLTRRGTNISQAGKAMFILATMAFLSYFSYFLYAGPSYQQWKLASYLPLFISFPVLAALGNIPLPGFGRFTGTQQKSGIIAICTLVVIGNLVSHLFKEPPLEKFSADYANLKALEMIGDSQAIYVQMATFSSTFFPVYFVQNKVLHLLSPSYFPQAAPKYEEVSSKKPLFVEGEPCEADAGNISIHGVGCLFNSPPMLKCNTEHYFRYNILGLENPFGLSAMEPFGRWSDAARVEFGLRIPRNATTVKGGYVNFEVTPFLFKTSSTQRVLINWGKSKSARGSIRSRGWISLPYSEEDFDDLESNRIIFRFDLPDAISPHDLDPLNGESRKLGLGFIALSLTKQPRGNVFGVD